MMGGGAVVRGAMARHIFVIGRAHRDLFDFLEKQFAEDANVSVVLDRRVTDRRRARISDVSLDANRRRPGDRRGHPSIDEELKSRSHAIITLPD